ncbi:MAG: (2Fe-2S)-binding protein [Phycisphaerales bacterium]|jgi:bacterioferritin-associated ferredoxin|nr:(2Fe-2S)-binding protein [Phycisphaerales bacterium]
MMDDSIDKPLAGRPQPMVDRCVCHDISFADILTWSSQRERTTLDDIREHFGCGESCGTCVPYIRQVLGTRQCSIPLMLDTSD